jgi:hypothetical protein
LIANHADDRAEMVGVGLCEALVVEPIGTWKSGRRVQHRDVVPGIDEASRGPDQKIALQFPDVAGLASGLDDVEHAVSARKQDDGSGAMTKSTGL